MWILRFVNLFKILTLPDFRESIKFFVFQLTTGNLHTVYTKHDDYVQVLFLTKDAMKMVSGSRDHTMIVWNTKTADRIHTLRGHNQCVRDLTLTNNDEYLFSIGDDGKWIVWDMETGNKLLKRDIYKTDGTCCRLSSDETRFYTGSEGCDIKMWCNLLLSQKTLKNIVDFDQKSSIIANISRFYQDR